VRRKEDTAKALKSNSESTVRMKNYKQN